jgi:hypothetical protein
MTWQREGYGAFDSRATTTEFMDRPDCDPALAAGNYGVNTHVNGRLLPVGKPRECPTMLSSSAGTNQFDQLRSDRVQRQDKINIAGLDRGLRHAEIF